MSDQISALDGGDERALVHARATLVGVCPELHAVFFFVSVGDRRRCLLGLHLGMRAKWGMQRNVCPGLICATMRLKLAIAAHRNARWLGSWAIFAQLFNARQACWIDTKQSLRVLMVLEEVASRVVLSWTGFTRSERAERGGSDVCDGM